MKKTLLLGVLLLAACGNKKDKAPDPAPASGSAPAVASGSAPAVASGSAPAPAAAMELTDKTPMDVGKGVMLSFTKKETNKGGDNQPPTMKHTVTAKCGGKDVVVLESEDEGGDAKVNVTTEGEKATVVMDVHIAREGETLDEKHTATLDVASCAVTKMP